MKKLVEYYCELPAAIRPVLWRVWHHLISRLDADDSKIFLNYGYASPNGEFKDLKLGDQDERDRYGIQLYDHVTKGVSLSNMSVLEVGCGRGGGASFLARYRQPKVYVALDISQELINFCNRFYRVPGLEYVCGSATNLPFKAECFDAVVNVESARCYGDIPAFFQEVYRVLNPGGYFFFADMIKNQDVDQVHRWLQAPGFDIIRQQDIRENVVLSLQLDTATRKKTIDDRVPAWLRKSFYEFAGVAGSNRFKAFTSNEMQYRSYMLRKKQDLS